MLILQLWYLKSANLMKTQTSSCQETLRRLTIIIVYLIDISIAFLSKLGTSMVPLDQSYWTNTCRWKGWH